MINDAIGDLLVRIKNASMANRSEVSCPYSRFRESLTQILQNEKVINSYELIDQGAKKKIIINLLKQGNKCLPIEAIRISKLGRRVYVKANALFKMNRGVGITLVSTPRGLMTTRQARKENLGGELICRIVK